MSFPEGIPELAPEQCGVCPAVNACLNTTIALRKSAEAKFNQIVFVRNTHDGVLEQPDVIASLSSMEEEVVTEYMAADEEEEKVRALVDGCGGLLRTIYEKNGQVVSIIVCMSPRAPMAENNYYSAYQREPKHE